MHLDLSIFYILTRYKTKILSKISLCFCSEVNQSSLIDPSYFYCPFNQIIS